MLHMAMKTIKNIYMCVVIRIAIGFRPGYHHVKRNAENKYTLRRNTLMKAILNLLSVFSHDR